MNVRPHAERLILLTIVSITVTGFVKLEWQNVGEAGPRASAVEVPNCVKLSWQCGFRAEAMICVHVI